MENSFCSRWVKFGSTFFIRLAGGACGGSQIASGTTGFDLHALSASSDSSKHGFILRIGFVLLLVVLRVEIEQQLLGFFSGFIGSSKLPDLHPPRITFDRQVITSAFHTVEPERQVDDRWQ